MEESRHPVCVSLGPTYALSTSAHGAAPPQLHHLQRLRCDWAILACPRGKRFVQVMPTSSYSFESFVAAEEASKDEEAQIHKGGIACAPEYLPSYPLLSAWLLILEQISVSSAMSKHSHKIEVCLICRRGAVTSFVLALS